jgi:hypothetical protein
LCRGDFTFGSCGWCHACDERRRAKDRQLLQSIRNRRRSTVVHERARLPLFVSPAQAIVQGRKIVFASLAGELVRFFLKVSEFKIQKKTLHVEFKKFILMLKNITYVTQFILTD